MPRALRCVITFDLKPSRHLRDAILGQFGCGGDTSGHGTITAAIGTFTPASATVSLNVVTSSNGTVTGRWLATLDASAGWLSIESLSTRGVSGAFAFTLVPGTPETPNVNKVVTNGIFDATF